MFINKILGFSNKVGFKGYEHKLNNVGEQIYRFNYPFDYENETCELQIFDVKEVEKEKYQLNETPIATIPLTKNGVNVNIQSITNNDKDKPFAYRFARKDKTTGKVKYVADTGVKINNGNPGDNFRVKIDDKIKNTEYTFVSRRGTTPKVVGAGYLVFPDSQRVGVKYKDFDDPNTGEIYIDKAEQKEKEQVIRTFSNKLGGNLAGMEYNLDYLASNGYKIQFANPVAGGDNKSSHHYWNKNNFQISDDMGNMENFASYSRKLFQKGMIYVYDGTFTSEGLEGIHFQYALRWADKNPQSYYWFKMQSIKDQNLGLGTIPKHKENLRHRVINPSHIYNESTKKVEKNPNYNPNKETYFQIYDASQVTDGQLSKLDKPIETYEKLRSNNFIAINTHDDTLINYVFQIDPKEYYNNLKTFSQLHKDTVLNSPDGTILISQFSNFKMDRKTEGGQVAWDANTDMVKMNYHISGYDEKIDQAIVDYAQREYEKQMRVRGAFEVQDMTLQAGRFWTRNVRDNQLIYSAQVLKGSTTYDKIQELISNGLLPKEASLEKEAIDNVLNHYYKLAPKGVLSKDDTTIKALMQIPLDSLEFNENTVGVLSTSYFSNRATSEETLGLTRFELMQKENPHLTEDYAKTYLKTNFLFTDDIKDFADEIIKKVDANSNEKLLDSNGDYTEYGEYVIELMAPSITKYAFFKSLAGDKLKTKILPNGEITYDYIDLKENTSLKSLGINGTNPTDEAEQLYSLIKKGMNKLNEQDIEYLSKSISNRIAGTNVNSFRLAEAMVNKAGLGLAWRLDAAKDVVDQDAGRSGDVAHDENWRNLINFWKQFVDVVKKENPDSYIVAEITDQEEVMQGTLGEKTGCYYSNMPDIGLKYRSVPEAQLKFYNETGITSEAGYSYLFSDIIKTFSVDFADGKSSGGNIIGKVGELIKLRGLDFTRNLFTFVGNHDKTRTIHGLALDMELLHSSFNIFDNEGKANFEKNRKYRKEALLQLTNSDKYEDLPLEAKLNIDNPEYFSTVSNKAIAMSQLLRNAINDSLPNVATEEEIKYLKAGLVDLTNGNYLGSGETTQIQSINIPELSSFENALKAMIEKSGISLTEAEFNDIIKRANDPELINQYTVQGDFDWGAINEEVGKRNQKNIDLILRGSDESTHCAEKDFIKYSTYTVGIAGILRQAFIDVKGEDANARASFLNAAKDFVKKYDKATIEANRTELPFIEGSDAAMAKNGYASRDIKTAIEMAIHQAEYIAQKEGKLAEGDHFANLDKIMGNMYQSATEPAIQKFIMMMSFLSALVGIPTLYGGDELGLSGYEEKAKNVFLQSRNALPWSELEEGVLKDYRNKIMNAVNDAMKIRSREGVDALNNGTAYTLKTSDKKIPAFMMQDSYGNMTISVFNASGINVSPRYNYFEALEINENNKEEIFNKEKIESFNENNPYVPIQKNTEIEHIALDSAISLPIGLTFLNSDLRDKTEYIVDYIKDQSGKIIGKGIFSKGKGKISLNGLTAKNGTMILKHVAFRAQNPIYQKQFNIISNPYSKIENPSEGEKLSLIAR